MSSYCNVPMSRRKKILIIFGISLAMIIPTTVVISITFSQTSQNLINQTSTTISIDIVSSSLKRSCLVNAWIFLNEDQPINSTYKTVNSSYQRLIEKNIYQSIDILFIAFISIILTSNQTIPVGNGQTYTIHINSHRHSEGLTNEDYMNYIIRDAKINNPNIKIMVVLDWSNETMISRIFTTTNYDSHLSVKHFTLNLIIYLKKYDLDGLDIDWEYPLSLFTTQQQFIILIKAIRDEFEQQTKKYYYLTISPAEVGNLDAETVNKHIDFLNLQLYSRLTYPDRFKSIGIDSSLFAYGVKFENEYQTAIQAYEDNQNNYHYNIFTCWKLNSDNYLFEQVHLYNLCH